MESREMVAQFFRDTREALAQIAASVERNERLLREVNAKTGDLNARLDLLENRNARLFRILENKPGSCGYPQRPLRSSDVHTDLRSVRGGDVDHDAPTGKHDIPAALGATRTDQTTASPSGEHGAPSGRTLTSRWTGLWPAAAKAER